MKESESANESLNESVRRLFTEKAMFTLPILASVMALIIFLILVFPNGSYIGKHGKQSQAGTDHAGNGRVADDSRGAGWRSNDTHRGQGRNTTATAGTAASGKSKRGGASRSGESGGNTWWYNEDGAKEKSTTNDGWWYK